MDQSDEVFLQIFLDTALVAEALFLEALHAIMGLSHQMWKHFQEKSDLTRHFEKILILRDGIINFMG